MFGLRTPCPKCFGHTFRTSKSGWLRYLTRLVFLRPFRCTHCQSRVWRFALRANYDRLRRTGEQPKLTSPPTHPPAAAA
jgi:hypothetical protein